MILFRECYRENGLNVLTVMCGRIVIVEVYVRMLHMYFYCTVAIFTHNLSYTHIFAQFFLNSLSTIQPS